MGRHSIPGPEDTPKEPFGDDPPPEQVAQTPHGSDVRPPADQDPSPPVAPARDDESAGGRFVDGAWRGGHRSTETKRRGVSVGVIVALVAVVVVLSAIISWRFVGHALSNRSNVAAATCSGSAVPVAVVADPSISDKIVEFANRYNQSVGPIGDHCVKIGVKAADSDNVINGFVGAWPSELGQRPALWIPASGVSIARLQAVAGEKIISDSRSVATTPVVLAIKPQLKAALADQNWGTLPALQTNPVSLEAKNMPGWGSLRLALPTGNDDATYLAAEAVAAASVPPNTPATAGVGAVNTLIAGQPKLPNPSLSAAMDALLAGGDPAASPVHAVVITEQQLYQRSSKVPDAKNIVASWLPPGPTAVADYPMASLSGDWLSEEQVTAASEFKKFLQKPEQQTELAKAGFRAGNASLPKTDVTSFSPLSNTLSIGDDTARVTLADAVTAPAGGQAVTIMLDQSMPNQDGANTRLANAIAALNSKLATLPPNAVVGLWTFDGVEGRTEVATGPLSDQVNGQPRSAVLKAALDKQSSSAGGAVSFTTLRMIYDAAVAGFRPGMKNSVLVITSGRHTDQSMDGAALQNYVRKAFDQARPVAINVIDFGAGPDRGTWESVAQTSGGSYQNLPTSDSPDLTTAVATFLG